MSLDRPRGGVRGVAPSEALKARAALAIERREAAARRKAEEAAALRAHETHDAVQIYRAEKARKLTRDAVKIAEAKVILTQVLADVPSHRRGRPRKNTGAAA